MQAQRPQFAVKLLPSLTDFAFLMPIVFLFSRMEGVKTLLSDCDTGWHIRTGEWILANHAVPMHDIFSFSKPEGVWYAWEWLSEILWAFLFAHGGLRTVVFFSMMLICITFTLLFRLVCRKANPVIAVVVTMVAAAGSSIHWLARPHLFTLFFLVLFYRALENVRDGRTHVLGIPYLAILPVVTMVWTNLHGGFFVGIILIGSYGVAELLKVVFSPDPGATWRTAWTGASRYLFCAFACFAASFVNPYTYHLHVHVVQYLRDPYQATHIMEFLSLSFHHPVAIFFESMLLLSAGAAIWNASKRSCLEGVVLIVWAHAALLAARNIPLFMIVAAPPVAAALDSWLRLNPVWNVAQWIKTAAQRFVNVAGETAEIDGIPRWHAVSVLGALLLAALLYAPHPPQLFRSEFDPKTYPAAALASLREPGTRVFTHDEWGDYLIYRLYPRTKVFVDGRSDFYGDDFEEKYVEILNVKYGWDKTLSKFGVNTVLMPPTAPLAGALKESSRWRVVYDDGVAVVFRSLEKTAGPQLSVAAGDGTGRDREVTKTHASDQAITATKPKT